MPKSNHLQYLITYSSQSTTDIAKYSIQLFFQSIYGKGNIYEQADRYFQEKRDIETDLQTFFSTIKTRPPKTIQTVLSNVKTFLLENNVELSQRFWKRLKGRIKGSKARTQDRIPTTEEIKQILMRMPQHGQAFFLTLLSSGGRIGEISKITMDDIELNKEPARIHLRGSYTKSGDPRVIFISQEAKQFILEFLKNRDEYHKSAREAQREYSKKHREEWNLAMRIGVSVPDARKMLGKPTLRRGKKPHKAEDFLAPDESET